jgi:nucleotide-binding universal stress UspA family protein
MYQRILIAVDGSDTSYLALDHAVQLAQHQQARLRIVHVVELFKNSLTMLDGAAFDATPLWQALREEGRQTLSVAEAKARSSEVESEIAMLEGDEASSHVATTIVKDAQGWAADLIVLGTHGRRGFNRILLGSVAETLVRMAPAPVLLVRARPRAEMSLTLG